MSGLLSHADPRSRTAATHELVKEPTQLPLVFCTPARGKDGCSPPPIIESASFTIPIHWHEYLEFLYLLDGHLSAIVNADSYELTPGEFLIINSEELHMTQTQTFPHECPYILIQFSAARLSEFFPNVELLHFQNYISQSDLKKTPQLTPLVLEMQRLFETQPDGYQLLLTSHFYEFLHILYQNYSYWEVSQPKQSAGRDFGRITEIVDWTRTHSKSSITLEDAASHLGLSREYFCRIFKKYTGQTYLEYLSSVRTMNFYEQLLTSDLSIPVLMEQNGITNYRTFLRTFRALYGTTPQKLRAGSAKAAG